MLRNHIVPVGLCSFRGIRPFVIFGSIAKVELLGYNRPLKWKQDEDGLIVQFPRNKPCKNAFVLKITTVE